MFTVHGNDLSGPSGQVASPLYPRSYMHDDTFFWRIMVDFGQVVAITFREFFIDTYFSGCDSYLAVSNEINKLIFLDIFVVKRVAANDGLFHWEFKFKQLIVLCCMCFKFTVFKMYSMSQFIDHDH